MISISVDLPDRTWWHASYASGDSALSALRRRKAILAAKCERTVDKIARPPEWKPDVAYPADAANR